MVSLNFELCILSYRFTSANTWETYLLVGKEFMADLLVDLMFDKMQIYALNGGLNQAYLLHLKKLWVKNLKISAELKGILFKNLGLSNLWETLSKTPVVFEKSEVFCQNHKIKEHTLIWAQICKKINLNKKA